MGTRTSRSTRHRTALLAVTLLLAGTFAACSSSSDDAGPSNDGDTTTTTSGDATPSDAKGKGEFTVLSYNVAGLPQEISKENPKEHMPLISPLLEQYDVVLTQEDFDWYGELAKPLDVVNYHGRLRKDVTHEYQSKPHPGPEAVDLPAARLEQLEIGDGLGFLSRFEMEDETRIPWIDCANGAADCLAMKGFSFQRMVLARGITVDVYDLHLEAGGGEDDQAVQGKDVKQLQEYVLTHSKGHAVILGGDTNLHTDDVHPDGGKGADTKLWNDFLAATGLLDACAETDCPDTGRIDKIAFRSDDGVTLEATDYEVPAERFKDSKGDDLSDHEPLVVTFRWSSGTD